MNNARKICFYCTDGNF